MPINVVIPDPPFFDTAGLEQLAKANKFKLTIHRKLAVDASHLQSRIVDANIIIVDVLSDYNRLSLSGCKHLKHLISASVALNHVDLVYCRQQGIDVHSFRTYNSRAVAEMAFANLIALLRHIPHANLSVRSNLWLTERFEGEELKGKTLGIIGAGNIGKELIAIGLGFGMRIHCHTQRPSDERAHSLGLDRFYSLDETLSSSDFLILAVTSTDETRNLINEHTLKLMRPSSYLINMGRQYLVETRALARALYRRALAGAALDFVGDEPYSLFADDPEIQEMVNRPNVIVTPHIGFNTKEASERLSSEVVALVGRLIS